MIIGNTPYGFPLPGTLTLPNNVEEEEEVEVELPMQKQRPLIPLYIITYNITNQTFAHSC